jgi:formyltetrahydrofolate-dependent phosphoribosylglycinamide formyltransferase
MSDEPGKRYLPLRLAVLVSGSGTTLQNLIDEIAAGRLSAEISLVVGSRPGLKGLDRAVAAGIPQLSVDRRAFSSAAEFSRAVFEPIENAQVDLICMAGWLCLLDIPSKYSGRVMNIHPALLPAFGGKGMYGQKVHQAVIDHGCKISGCTVHFVDQAYDNGPIIMQRACAVEDGDTAATLAARVFEEEKVAYRAAINLFQQNRLKIDGRRVVISR